MLSIYGSLFFAAASNLEDKLPKVQNARHAVVIVRLRGMENVGSTFITVLTRYHQALHAHDCKLLLAEISKGVLDQLERTGMLEKLGEANIFPETPRVYYATRQALRAGTDWLNTPAV